MSQLLRCTVRTPCRVRCGCPVRWDGRQLVHAPELETNADEFGVAVLSAAVEMHRIHIGAVPTTSEDAHRLRRERGHRLYSCLHTPRLEDAAQTFVKAALQDRPLDLELVKQGLWIKRRSTPPPEGERRYQVKVVWDKRMNVAYVHGPRGNFMHIRMSHEDARMLAEIVLGCPFEEKD